MLNLDLLLASIVDIEIEPIDPPGWSGGVEGVTEFLSSKVVDTMGMAFFGVLFLMLFLYSATMIMKSHDEGAVGEARQAFLHAIFGSAIVGFAVMISEAIAVRGGGMLNPSAVNPAFTNVYLYLKLALSAVLIMNIVIQGFRLISAQGDESIIDRARGRLISSFIGVAIVLLANAIALSVLESKGSGFQGTQLMNEIAGGINFILTLIGGAALIAFIVAGIMLVVAVDDAAKDKAKQMMKTIVITLIILLISFVLVNFFIFTF